MTVAVAELRVDPARARVYEHGWQSWSPTGDYGLAQRPPRATSARNHLLAYRPDRLRHPEGFRGEGLLAVDPGDGGPVSVLAAPDGRHEVPSIGVQARGGTLLVTADAPVDHDTDDGPGGLAGSLARWADAYAARLGVAAPRPAPTIWCSWYQYFTAVTEADLVENLQAIDRLDVAVDVVQLDDGYQAEVGDWLSLSQRFASLDDLVARIRDGHGRRAGIWVAPFLAAARSRLVADHPDWLVGGAEPVAAGFNWNQRLFALDTTHPGAQDYLAEVFGRLVATGIDFFKLDFVYAGALDGRRAADATALEAYRLGLEVIRQAVGVDAYLLGCGAPLLPSLGLVDAMRVSPDTAPHFEPVDGDLSQPGIRSALSTGAARAFQHGRFWVNDPDCLVARPEVEQRERWAAHVERSGGLRGSSDRLADLDSWGL